MKESNRKTTDNRATKKGVRLHADLSGQLPTSFLGYNYYLAIIDNTTRHIWTALLRSKEATEAVGALRLVVKEVETHTGRTTEFVRVDNGKSEFGEDFI